jgi:hypothetical protein
MDSSTSGGASQGRITGEEGQAPRPVDLERSDHEGRRRVPRPDGALVGADPERRRLVKPAATLGLRGEGARVSPFSFPRSGAGFRAFEM